MGQTETLKRPVTARDQPWQVIVYDDPVNLMDYVTWVFMSVLGYARPRAEKLMREVHEQGRSIVWTGAREKAELHTQQLQAHQLRANLEKAGE
jgi:ATP-dependent Clp protease adaptor protein ClpS